MWLFIFRWNFPKEEADKVYAKVKKNCKLIVISRAAIKRKITWQIKYIHEYIKTPLDINKKVLLKHIGTITNLLVKCSEVNSDITNQYESLGLVDTNYRSYKLELNSQMSYEYSVNCSIAEFESFADTIDDINNQNT